MFFLLSCWCWIRSDKSKEVRIYNFHFIANENKHEGKTNLALTNVEFTTFITLTMLIFVYRQWTISQKYIYVYTCELSSLWAECLLICPPRCIISIMRRCFIDFIQNVPWYRKKTQKGLMKWRSKREEWHELSLPLTCSRFLLETR